MKRRDELFSAHTDGRLTDADALALRELIARDPEARRDFARWMLLEQALSDRFFGGRLAREIAERPVLLYGAWRRRMPRIWPRLLAASLVAAAGAVLFVAMARRAAPVAVVLESSADLRWDDARGEERGPGTLLGRGSIRLRAGTARILFASGALVTLQGPADFDVRRADRAALHRGRLSAQVPPRARGFVVDSGNLRAIDLGTAFGMSVDRMGREVHVFDGRVDVSVAESTNGVLQLRTGQALRVGADRALERMPARAADFDLSLPEELLVPAAYVQMVRERRPVGYWRFESTGAGLTPNETSPAFAARLVGRASVLVSGINGHLDFQRSTDPGCLRVDEPLPLKGRDYSIEFWFRPEAYDDGGTMVGLLQPGTDRHHAALVEKALPIPGEPTGLRAVTLRYLHRDPPETYGGTNLYASAVTPGRWHHVVATKGAGRNALYLDGRLVADARDASILSIDPVVVMGQLLGSDHRWDRIFAGAMDEVAIYDHALDAAAVAAHYRLIRPVPTGRPLADAEPRQPASRGERSRQ